MDVSWLTSTRIEASLSSVIQVLSRLVHIEIVVRTDVLKEHGSFDRYLEKTLSTEA